MAEEDAVSSSNETIGTAEVHEALGCLYDGLALGRVALAARLPELQHLASAPEKAVKLRTLLLDGIELLQPERPASFRSAATRSYDVMTLRFVEGLTMTRIAEELYISERQAYRDLVHAEEQLANLLGSQNWAAEHLQVIDTGDTADTFGGELQNVVPQSTLLDLDEILGTSLCTVRPLAETMKVSFIRSLPGGPLLARGDPALLRATLVEMLSVAVRCARDRKVHIDADVGEEQVTLKLRFSAPREVDPRVAYEGLAGLARAQGLLWRLDSTPDLTVTVSITLSSLRRRLVLVLEDNESTIELYRRYLAGSQEWELQAIVDPRRGLEMALEIQPAVIVLDVLMPEQDGWQVLQTLHAQPETAHIPVLICSVFDEMELARALGATVYLKKPVTREQFLAALDEAQSRGSNLLSRSPARS